MNGIPIRESKYLIKMNSKLEKVPWLADFRICDCRNFIYFFLGQLLIRAYTFLILQSCNNIFKYVYVFVIPKFISKTFMK